MDCWTDNQTVELTVVLMENVLVGWLAARMDNKKVVKRVVQTVEWMVMMLV